MANHSKVVPTRDTPLSDEEVRKIVASYKPGEVGYMALAKSFGVSTGTIRKIIKLASGGGAIFTPYVVVAACRTGKRGYPNYELASTAAAYINKRNPTSGESVWPYRCSKCQAWHVGRLKP